MANLIHLEVLEMLSKLDQEEVLLVAVREDRGVQEITYTLDNAEDGSSGITQDDLRELLTMHLDDDTIIKKVRKGSKYRYDADVHKIVTEAIPFKWQTAGE